MPDSKMANLLAAASGIAWILFILSWATGWGVWWFVFIPIALSSVAGKQRQELQPAGGAVAEAAQPAAAPGIPTRRPRFLTLGQRIPSLPISRSTLDTLGSLRRFDQCPSPPVGPGLSRAEQLSRS